jgi:hypothetical protein
MKDLRIYESYTETWATILNILFHTTTTEEVEREISKEQHWACIQYRKIMNFYGLGELSPIKAETELIRKEKVTLYAYYILKCRFLIRLNEFIGFCIKNNNKERILDFTKTVENTNAFIDFILIDIYGVSETADNEVGSRQRNSSFSKRTYRKGDHKRGICPPYNVAEPRSGGDNIENMENIMQMEDTFASLPQQNASSLRMTISGTVSPFA